MQTFSPFAAVMLLIRISVGLSLSLKAPCLCPPPDFVCASGIVDELLNKYPYSATCKMHNKVLQQDDENGLYKTTFQMLSKMSRATPVGNDSAKTGAQRLQFM